MSSHLARIIATDLGVQSSYVHVDKRVTADEPIEPPGCVLKWYGIAPIAAPIPSDVAALARTHLLTQPLEARGLGFVLLHRCGADFYFLIVCTWRGENELWETVFYKDGAMNAFATWPREAQHKPTFCVWEMVPVWHEQEAWVSFLRSARDEASAAIWLSKRFVGAA